jgi:hypothetical protein
LDRSGVAPSDERGFMLDFVFLALGLALLALFGGYAALLRRL